MQSTFRQLLGRRVIGGGGGGGRKLTSAISHAGRSGGVVGSSSTPSVCGILPQEGEEGVTGVAGVVVPAWATATGEKATFRFLLLLVCTPVCGVPAAAAAASGGMVSIAVAAAAEAPVPKDRVWGVASAAACVSISCWEGQAGSSSCVSCCCLCCCCSCCCCTKLPCCC